MAIKLSDNQYWTLIDIADRLDKGARTYKGEHAVGTNHYRRSTLNALERRGLVGYLDYGFNVAITETGQAIASADAALKASRLHDLRNRTAFKHRFTLQQIANSPAQQIVGGIIEIGAEKDLLTTGLIETCIVPAPQGCYAAEGYAIRGIRLTEAGKPYWAAVEPFTLGRSAALRIRLAAAEGE